MAFIEKILGGALGVFVGGPVGAIIGLAIGHQLDRGIDGALGAKGAGMQFDPNMVRPRAAVTQTDFAFALLVLSASVMKADGKVLRSELNYVRDFLERQFGRGEAAEQVKVLRNILAQDIPLRQVCLQIRQQVPHPMRLQLIH